MYDFALQCIIQVTEEQLGRCQIVTQIPLETAKLMIEYNLARRDAQMKERWLKFERGEMPSLPSDLSKVMGNTNMVKSLASKFLNWLMESNDIRFVNGECFNENLILNFRTGETYFSGWFHRVDSALFVHTMKLMPGMKMRKFICLNNLIDFKALKGIKSLSNGNVSAVKKESKISGWLPFLKIFLEWAQIVTEGLRESAQKRAENSDDDFVQVKKLSPNKDDKLKKKPAVVKRISEALKRKRPTKKIETERGGVDDETHLVMALQISAMEEERRQEVGREAEMVEAAEESESEQSEFQMTPILKQKRTLGPRNQANTAVLDPDTNSSFPDSPLFASTRNFAPGTNFLSSSTTSSSTTSSTSSSTSSFSSHHSPAPNASDSSQSTQSPMPLSVASMPGRKMVKINDFTVSEHPEKALHNMSNLSEKCQGRKKQLKSLKYGKPEESESDADDLDMTKITRRRLEKAKIKPFEVKEALDKGSKIMTPVNLQIVGWTWDKDTEDLEVSMSDGKFIYPMLLSSQFSWMVGKELHNNTIVTVTEIKKKRGSRKPIIMHLMIDSKIQTEHTLGNPMQLKI